MWFRQAYREYTIYYLIRAFHFRSAAQWVLKSDTSIYAECIEVYVYLGGAARYGIFEKSLDIIDIRRASPLIRQTRCCCHHRLAPAPVYA